MTDLRVAIVSTPKTGNTWLKNILSVAYNIPIVTLPRQFNAAEASKLGPSWVSHEHYFPSAEVFTWAEQNNIRLLTTIRHPCDILISLYHYTLNFAGEQQVDQRLLSAAKADGENLSDRLADFIEKHFFSYLNTSIAWHQTGRSCVVRYEDLWRDPVTTLTRLTSKLGPLSDEVIESAIARCDFELLRKKAGKHQKFYRQGNVGNWRRELPLFLVNLFRTKPPYPDQLAVQEYSLDFDDPLIDAPRVPLTFHNPFREIDQFENGVLVPPVVADLYCSASRQQRAAWGPPHRCQGESTFYTWLNKPAMEDEGASQGFPFVSNLAAHIYRVRHDLQNRLPDLYGRDRIAYLSWFLRDGSASHQLPKYYLESVYDSFLTWASSSAAQDANCPDSLPPLTNLMAHIYSRRADLQSAFSEPMGANRIDFFLWFMRHGLEANSYHVHHESSRRCFLRWASLTSPSDPLGEEAAPAVTNLADYLWRTRPSLAKQYPDPYGAHRIDFVSWLCHFLSTEPGLGKDFLVPIAASWARRSRTEACPFPALRGSLES
jgi:hypothetical protein